MEPDHDVSMSAGMAFDAGNLVEFRSLLRAYPELLRGSDGRDRWMWQAAIIGNLPFLQCLVGLGQDVNESMDVPDPEDPFCQFEGPILHAAGEGHLEVVRWLLEQGAKINYTVNGKIRCLPLLRAASYGHLEVAKLLVDHGADIHAAFNGHTPLSQAVNYGHPEVAEYLRSVGAKQ